jgi:hypothetical protein
MRTFLTSLVSVGAAALIACGGDSDGSTDAGNEAGTDAGANGGNDDAGKRDAGSGPDAAADVDAGRPEFDGGPGNVTVHEEDGLSVATITTSKFVIAPGEERYVCQNFSNPYDQDVAVVTSAARMTGGSHHMFAFQKEVTDGPLQDCSGLEFGPAVHTQQVPESTTTYPDGVARALRATDGLRVQAHYLNVTDEPITAEIEVVLRASTKNDFKLAATLFYSNSDLDIPPQSLGFAERTCTLPRDIELVNLASHMHQFGTHAIAKLEDSTVLFETDEWSHPIAAVFDPPLLLKAGTKITYRCEYNNTSDLPLTFGESALTNEMCIISGQFFPAEDSRGIGCGS